MIRLMIADDEEGVRNALSSLLDDDEQISSSAPDVTPTRPSRSPHASSRTSLCWMSACPEAGTAGRARDRPGEPGHRAHRPLGRRRPRRYPRDAPRGGRRLPREGRGDGRDRRRDPPLHRRIDGRTRWAALLPRSFGTRPFGSRERLRRIESVVRGQGLDVVYQPIFDLHDGRPVGAEALSRFSAVPVRTPDAWFAEAADVGLGIELEDHGRSSSRPEPGMAGAVDHARCQRLPGTCCSPELSELLEIVPAHRLVLEITENAPVLDYERLANALGPLRARGVRLAIDDTCSGYASLRHVLHLRPDTIKLDITLTRGVETDTARRLLVEALVGFAPSVGAEVLAEGIESAVPSFAP